MKKNISLAAVALLTVAMQMTSFAQTAPARVNTDNDTATGKRKLGDPYAVMPPNIERLTYFGERADISPDNKQVAFMSKSFGDAMVIDLKTRQISCLTCGIPAAAFLRVMHLSNGDYLLIGADHFEDIRTSRTRDNELWYMSKKPGSKPVKLGQRMSEGAAISKKTMKLSFAELHDQIPEVKEGASRIVVVDLDLSGSEPKLVNRQIVFESPDKSCTVEPGDFYDNDSKLTFTCYEPGNNGSVMTIDLKTKEVVNNSKAPGTYNEVEGIFPDGKYVLVEGDRQCAWLGGHGSGNADIWKLRLDGTGKDFVRLTNFNDIKGGKVSNPVVATNGEFFAFQMARAHEVAGVGYGLLLYKFKK